MDTTPKPLPQLSERQVNRFWSKVDKTDGCWIWQGNIDPKWGYGRIWIEPHGLCLAHRVAWMLGTRNDPGHLCVLHSCDNPPCVRYTDHLFLGTRQDNADDMHQKGRYAGHNRRFAQGSRVGTATLTERDVRLIRELWATGNWYQAQLANGFRTSQENISLIVNRQAWKHI